MTLAHRAVSPYAKSFKMVQVNMHELHCRHCRLVRDLRWRGSGNSQHFQWTFAVVAQFSWYGTRNDERIA
jgi:hypothetical protein